MARVTRFPVLAKAVIDTGKLSVVAPLTYPIVDIAGDYVDPAGGNFEPHQDAGAWVGLEHWRLKKGSRSEIVQPDDPDAGRPVIAGYARESLSDPDGVYAVEMKQFTIKGQRYSLPVGTTYYDPDNRLSAQVFAMIERDALPGVSLEFEAPVGYTPIVLKAQSPMDPKRPAWRFDRWDCLGWVNCARPVNPGALVAKSRQEDTLRSLLSAGKIGSEAIHPLILKSLIQYIPARDRSRILLGKAMDEQLGPQQTEPTVYDDANAESVDDDQGTPTAQAAYDAAQMLVDVCERIKDGLKKSEHVAGKKQLMKLCDQIEAMAEKFIATGDKVTSDVGLGEDATGELAEDDPEVEGDALEADEDDPEKAMKAFRAPHRKIYRKSLIRPFTKQEIADAPVIHVEDREDLEDLEREARAARKFRRARLLYGS